MKLLGRVGECGHEADTLHDVKKARPGSRAPGVNRPDQYPSSAAVQPGARKTLPFGSSNMVL